jgi:hypothetical protein
VLNHLVPAFSALHRGRQSAAPSPFHSTGQAFNHLFPNFIGLYCFEIGGMSWNLPLMSKLVSPSDDVVVAGQNTLPLYK